MKTKTIAISTINLKPSLKKLVRPMNEGEWKRFLADVRAHGIREPLVLNAEDELLDGYHRLKAAKALGLEEVPYRTRNPRDEVAYVRSANVHRRHLGKIDVEAALKAMGATKRGKLGPKGTVSLSLKEGYEKIADE